MFVEVITLLVCFVVIIIVGFQLFAAMVWLIGSAWHLCVAVVDIIRDLVRREL